MAEGKDGPASEDDLGPPTAPDGFNVCARGVSDEAQANSLARAVGDTVFLLSRRFDLATLDGVTVAYDYAQALAELERGCKSQRVLTATSTDAVGVAMTPSVIRDGKLKSHMVFHAHYVAPLSNDSVSEDVKQAVHLVAHECAHVEISAAFDRAFPELLLRPRAMDCRQILRAQTMLSCWDEYAATLFSARYGADPTADYVEVFAKRLASAPVSAVDAIASYRLHGNVERVYTEVACACSDLLKSAAYVLGSADGLEVDPLRIPEFAAALDGNWLKPFVERLQRACRAIVAEYGRWTNHDSFEVIGDIVDGLVATVGIKHRYLPDGRLHIDIPW